MNSNNFIIDRVNRGIMVNSSGEYMWSINQVTDPSLSVTAETAEAVDALGSRIATFNRSKQATFSASNSIFDLGLYAAQMGVEVAEGGASNPLTVPAFEEYTLAASYAPQVLKHAAVGTLGYVYRLNGDGSVAQKYEAADTADATHFVYAADTHTVTWPTGLSAGTVMLVMYEYSSEAGAQVTGDGVNFPKSGKFVLDVIGCDVCDQTSLIHAYIVFPNAKLDANVDISFTTDGNHPFTLQANQDYCDSQKTLFKIVIPGEA